LGASATILGNFVGTNGIGTIIVQNGDEGIAIETSGTSATIGDGSVAGQNIIGGNLDANIDVLDSSSAVIDNNLIGIGAGADGSASLDYDITLDVPANTPGYRIDFFKNTSADPTGHGEGEIYLGAIEVSGAGSHIGTFTAGMMVSIGDDISTTTTRKTGPLTYDITSEFSQNATAIDANPALLSVVKTVAPLNTGDYYIPSTDIIYTFAVTNEGDGAVDTDTVLLIDSLPPEIIFFNGDHDGPGPSTEVVGFEETGTSLSFDANTDALFSDGVAKPANLSECDYVPAAGYDPNIKYVCFNPKGQMLGGDSNPNFSIRFRARIQ